MKSQTLETEVYSALGLATALTSDAIVPDYNESVAAVYREMAELLIRNAPEGQKLDILGHIDHSARDLHKEIEQTNSWVPDWRYAMLGKPFGKYIADSENAGQDVYGADGSKHEEISFAGTQPRIKDTCIDVIKQVSAISDDLDDTSIEQSYGSGVDSFAYPTGEETKSAFLHTITADVRSIPSIDRFKLARYRGFAMDWR